MIKISSETLKILRETLKFTINENYYMSYINDNDYIFASDIFQDFLADKQNNIKQYQWDLIPAEQYHNALKMYMHDGANFKFPQRTLENWLNIICKNLMILEVFTDIAGHSSSFPIDDFNDSFLDEENYIDSYYKAAEILENNGFYDWAVLPDGTDAISDYGIKPIAKILSDLPDFPSSEEIIIAINRCLDIAHCRGDLASAFIEGGAKSCWKISNM